ncbi:hypothetical protein ACLOJK_026909 [Asimina triloba]
MLRKISLHFFLHPFLDNSPHKPGQYIKKSLISSASPYGEQRILYAAWSSNEVLKQRTKYSGNAGYVWFAYFKRTYNLTLSNMQRAYVVYPPEGPRPPSPEEVQEMRERVREMRKKNSNS